MSLELFFSILLFTTVASITPGPNNLMLMAAGANVGFKKCLPQMLGVVFGFNTLIVSLALGLVAIISNFPSLELTLKILGSSYLAYLGIRLALSRSTIRQGNKSKVEPLSFLGSTMFQWVNPKGWSLGAAAIVAFVQPQQFYASLFLLTITYSVTNFISVACWTLFGTSIRRFLANHFYLRMFNIAMGLLLLLSIIPVWIE